MHLARRTVALAIALAAFVLGASTADARPDVDRAREAYDRGVRAHGAGDYAAAARAFADADALSPTTASLEAAIEAAMRADDAVLGAELLDRAATRTERDASLTKTISAARERFAGRTGTLRVECTGSEKCLVALDGRPVDASRPLVAKVGTHTVVVQRGDLRVERLVEVRADAVTSVAGPSASPATVPPLPAAAPASGLSPVWFYVGLGATALAGAGTLFSGLDANAKHRDFVASGCAPGATGPKDASCASRADAGSSAMLRTNLLLGATAFFAVSTAALGLVFVRWSPQPSGGVATLGARF